MEKTTIIASRDLDLHQAALLVQSASHFASRIFLSVGNKHANAKSMMSVVSLQLMKGVSVDIEAEGADETAAAEEIAKALTR